MASCQIAGEHCGRQGECGRQKVLPFKKRHRMKRGSRSKVYGLYAWRFDIRNNVCAQISYTLVYSHYLPTVLFFPSNIIPLDA
jgi:hypothetical protein